MNTTKKTIMKQLPQFSSKRCKQCGICAHFCALNAIGTGPNGMPYLADPNRCTSCGLCRDMCPDWAISLEATPVEMEQEEAEAAAPAQEAPASTQESREDLAAEPISTPGAMSRTLETARVAGD